MKKENKKYLRFVHGIYEETMYMLSIWFHNKSLETDFGIFRLND